MNESQIVVLSTHEVLGSIISYRLELLGNHPVQVSATEDLEMALSSTKVPLVIVDLDHCEGAGMSIVEKLSASERTCNVAILCLSSEGDLTLADATYRAGADDFLVVPFDMLVLEQKVSKLLSRVVSLKDQSETAIA